MLLTKRIAFSALGALLLAMNAGSAMAEHDDGHADGKTTICHETGSASNPFVKIAVSDNALAAHERHGDDVSPVGPNESCPGETDPTPDEEVVICHLNPNGTYTQVGPVDVDSDEFAEHEAHEDDLFLDADEDCPEDNDPEPTPPAGCSNTNYGVNVLQSCNLAAAVSVINLGTIGQSAEAGSGSGNDSTNTNYGLNVIQLADTALAVSGVNLGTVVQSAIVP